MNQSSRMEAEIIIKISSMLSQKCLTPSDFSYLKSLPQEVFAKAIEAFPPESTSKILDYLQKDISSPRVQPKERPVKKQAPKESTLPFLENYNKGMFKHLWLEDVKKIHRSIIPIENNQKAEEFPERLSLKNQSEHEKILSFNSIIEKMLYIFGEPCKCNRELAHSAEAFLKKFLRLLLDQQTLEKVLSSKQRKKSKKMAIKRIFNHYLKALFPDEFKKFSEVKEASKMAFMSDFIEEEKDHDLIDFAENFEEELSDREGEREKADANEEFEFLNARIDSMRQEEFLEFSYFRSLNFLSMGRESFLEFIEFKKLADSLFKDLKTPHLAFEIEFLNYVLCRVLKRAVENSIKAENNDRLKPLKTSISKAVFEEKADFEVISLKLKVKKLLAQKISIEEKAFQLFIRDFWIFDYQQILEPLNMKIKLVKSNSHDFKINNSKTQENDVDLGRLWSNMKGTLQKYWFQRILAENQVKKMIKDGTHQEFVNEFARVLYETLRSEPGAEAGGVFKEWFKRKIQVPSFFAPKVNHKLESIFD